MHALPLRDLFKIIPDVFKSEIAFITIPVDCENNLGRVISSGKNRSSFTKSIWKIASKSPRLSNSVNGFAGI